MYVLKFKIYYYFAAAISWWNHKSRYYAKGEKIIVLRMAGKLKLQVHEQSAGYNSFFTAVV